MFQYTSETIINKSAGSIPVTDNTTALDMSSARFLVDKTVPGNEMLLIDGVTAVKVADICNIYHTPYMAAEKAEAEITIPKATANKVLRLRINLTEQGNSRSILQTAYMHKQKPFTYEVIATGTEATDAAALKKVIERDLAESDFKLFSVADDNAKLTFTAADEYLRFTDSKGVVKPIGGAVIEVGEVEEVPSVSLTGREAFKVLGTGTVLKVGNQGAGTVKHLIKDLRIPTSAKADPLELKDGGMPIPGGKYDQYLIEVVTDRRHIAGGVVGSINSSLTSFVLFIEKEGALLDWETVLSDVEGVKQATDSDWAVKLAGIPVDASTGLKKGSIKDGAVGTDAATDDIVVNSGDNTPVADAKKDEVTLNKKS